MNLRCEHYKPHILLFIHNKCTLYWFIKNNQNLIFTYTSLEGFMQPLNIKLTSQSKAKYLQIADALRELIIKGDILAGSKLSSARDMAQAYGLNRHTIMNALQLLVAEINEPAARARTAAV